ncbi:Mlp family lipoprotein [Borrelia puertoricensis]|uniref:Mlp family lipoprotein n=1 Tax=Borrelia puertoricensis TaxID=2756107 RepID=UPI003EBF1B7D
MDHQYKQGYTDFKTWLKNNPQKQKELADAFTEAYDFLEEKRKKHAPNEKFDEYITNAILANDGNGEISYNTQNGKYGNTVSQILEGKMFGGNSISIFFSAQLIKSITTSFRTKSNEKTFEYAIESISYETRKLKQYWPEETN